MFTNTPFEGHSPNAGFSPLLSWRDGEGVRNQFLRSLQMGAQAELFIHSFVDVATLCCRIMGHTAIQETFPDAGIFSGLSQPVLLFQTSPQRVVVTELSCDNHCRAVQPVLPGWESPSEKSCDNVYRLLCRSCLSTSWPMLPILGSVFRGDLLLGHCHELPFPRSSLQSMRHEPDAKSDVSWRQ